MKLSYSVLDKKGYEWKKRFSSILMREALVEPLDRIFEPPKYTEDVIVRGYVPKKGGFFTNRPGIYNVQVTPSDNAKSKDGRLIMITFDDFLGEVHVPVTRKEFEKTGNESLEVEVELPTVSIRNMHFENRHAMTRNIKITDNPIGKPELMVFTGGCSEIGTNAFMVSFAHPAPLNVINIYPLPFALLGHYSSTITHELADSLLEDCKDKGKCVKKGVGKNFGELCKKELERLYL